MTLLAEFQTFAFISCFCFTVTTRELRVGNPWRMQVFVDQETHPGL